jgi:hypothetical protein
MTASHPLSTVASSAARALACLTRGMTSRLRAMAALSVTATVLALTGCGEFVERADPKPNLEKLSQRNFELDVDPIMRGTVASETLVTGFSPTVVRGYGLVVGLKGTGSRLMPADVRAHMLREMAARGVGNAAMGYGETSPEEMLNSDNCAVVIVEGVIPPGATKGTNFDVRVFAVPGSGTSSLEGGRLWTTELRPGPLLTGNRQGRALATANGDIFINPFVEPNAAAKRDTVNRLSGRILDGGEVTKDMLLRLRLATTSHSRAETIQSSINSLYPKEPGQKENTARGRSGDAIDITVPPSFEDRPEEFVQLVQHTPLLIEAPEMTATYVRRALLASPGMAEAASWRWRAIGKKSVPMIQDLYVSGEEEVRMAALVAGASLDDALAVEPLIEMARKGEAKNRLTAIELLGRFRTNPTIDIGLRPLLNDPDVDIRLGAFDTLVKRNDPIIERTSVDGKFDLVVVPSDRPMIYITQTGRPTIVLFGKDLEVERPLTFVAWSNRLMIKADSPADTELQVFWRPGPDQPAEIKLAKANLTDFVAFLGHATTIEEPAPGLGLSYAETIGALHLLWRRGGVEVDFKAEQDRILAAIIRSQKDDEVLERPEFDDLGDTVESGSDAGPAAEEDKTSDLANIEPEAAVGGASGQTTIERAGLQRDTVPR